MWKKNQVKKKMWKLNGYGTKVIKIVSLICHPTSFGSKEGGIYGK